MRSDRYCGQHTTNSDDAITAFESAVQAVAAHRPIGSSLSDALEQDPNLVGAYALQGYGNLLLGKSENFQKAREIYELADSKLTLAKGGSISEQALVRSLKLASRGHLHGAADMLEDYLTQAPRDFLAAKIAHALRFLCGQPDKMLATTSHVLPHLSEADSGYGFLLGCHAFGLEECGHFTKAEDAGRKALTAEPSDSWGLHAVSHVMEMSGRTQEGVDWLENSRSMWTRCNNFSFHLGWHLALFRLEQQDYESALAIYDADIRPNQTDDFRDMANAVSMLWRLEQEGVNVGDRWHGLHEIAHKRRNDNSYVFASLHYLLALVASGDDNGANELIATMRDQAARNTTDQCKIAETVGLEISELIISLARGGARRCDLVSIASRIRDVGGSHAQRDVFLRTLLLAAADDGDSARVQAIARVRRGLRCEDRFSSLVEERLRSAADFGHNMQTMTAAGH